MSSTDVVAISELSETEIDAVSGGGFGLILGSPNVNVSTQTNLAVLNFDEVAQSNSNATSQVVSNGGGIISAALAFARAKAR